MTNYVEYIGLPGSGKTTLLNSELEKSYVGYIISPSLKINSAFNAILISMLLPAVSVLCLISSPSLIFKSRGLLDVYQVFSYLIRISIKFRKEDLVYDQLIFQKIFILQCKASRSLILFLIKVSIAVLQRSFHVKIIYLKKEPKTALSRLKDRQLKKEHNLTQFDSMSDELVLSCFEKCSRMAEQWNLHTNGKKIKFKIHHV